MKKPAKTRPLCECGRPALRAGLPVKGADSLSNACARCAELESRRPLPDTAGSTARPRAGWRDISAPRLRRISAACDAFLARRGVPAPKFQPALS